MGKEDLEALLKISTSDIGICLENLLKDHGRFEGNFDR